jgi:hypothetical protein
MQTTFGTTEFRNGATAMANVVRICDGPIDLSWHHCGTTSEFLGEFFALGRAASDQTFNETRHSIGYLVNELLENAVKFRHPGDIVIESSLDAGRFELKVTNLIDGKTAARFQVMLAEVTACDPGDLLIQRIEANAADATSSGSGLGLLTLMGDYGARLGWKFHGAGEQEPVRLETFAVLDLP